MIILYQKNIFLMELSEFTDIIQQHQGKSDKDTVGLRLSIGERHTALLNRLASSPHAYHNLSHAIDIHKRLWLIYHGMLRASLREYGIRYRKMILI